MSVYERLSSINVNDHTEKKNGLTYLSWAWAWGELLKAYPDSTYTIYENKDGWCYHTDGRTAWVKTGVTVEGKEYIEMLPVMDFKNRSIPLEQITSFDVNKAIQRSLTKAVARHGLGLYIYAGEDLPETDATAGAVRVEKATIEPQKPTKPAVVTATDPAQEAKARCADVLRQNAQKAYGDQAEQQLTALMNKFGITFETMTGPLFKQINAMIIADGKENVA